MKKFYNKFKINNYTYIFFVLCALCGYLKNISIIFFICLIHEFGHIFFIKYFKYDIVCVELLPFGGFTTTNKRINSNINKDIIINFGGIFFQIIIYFVLLLLKNSMNIITYNLFINYNFIIMFFNLLPIIPLDGNNITHLFLEKFFSYKISYKINFIISTCTLIIFLVFNYLFSIDNYFIISFLIYKSINYIKNYKHLKLRFLIERYIYDLNYKKIDNNTQNINNLKKEVLHFFKTENKYINEKKKIEKYLYKNSQ